MSLRTSSVVLAVILVSIWIVSPSPASAGGLEYNEAQEISLTESADFSVGWTAAYGRVGFEPNGDELWIEDKAEDGKSVGMHWQTTGGRSGICRHKNGVSPFFRKCNKDFPEGDAIRIRMGRCNVTASQNCHQVGHYDWTSSWSGYVSVSGA